MDPTMLRCLIRLAGSTIADIARSLPSERSDGHLSHATITSVIDGRARSKRVENRIASTVGIPLHQIWPQWYGADGKPIKNRKRWQRIGAEAVKSLSDQLAERKVA